MKYQLQYPLILFVLLGLISCRSSEAFSKKEVVAAQKLIGLEYSSTYIDTMYNYLLRNLEGYDTMRSHPIADDVLPAMIFDPIPTGFKWPSVESDCIYQPNYNQVNIDNEEVAFMTIAEQGKLLRNGEITSVELTQLYIDRIKKYDPTLKCVITLMEEDAIKKAKKADQELAKGNDMGPLHGIPYGVKDLGYYRKED